MLLCKLPNTWSCLGLRNMKELMWAGASLKGYSNLTTYWKILIIPCTLSILHVRVVTIHNYMVHIYTSFILHIDWRKIPLPLHQHYKNKYVVFWMENHASFSILEVLLLCSDGKCHPLYFQRMNVGNLFSEDKRNESCLAESSVGKSFWTVSESIVALI